MDSVMLYLSSPYARKCANYESNNLKKYVAWERNNLCTKQQSLW